ncbi:MAG: hypothetical protein CVU87_08255 [Firmicutes bacterium HGW-Firmicutes-12]|nr:MAG: hypothetical protein CVU87_08255 [Firmicutes bacterium HGW-Firmicutes-12]
MSIILVVVIRSIISFFSLLILTRIMGKQQVAELTFFDYVVGITIGSIASTLSVQVNQNTIATLAGMGVWTILPIMLAYLSLHNIWIRKVVEGEGTVLIENGNIIEKNLGKVRITIDDLLSQMRTQGVFDITDVEFAIIESNGRLSLQKKSQKRPVTPSDLNLSTMYEGLPTNLIEDGILLVDAIESLKLSKAWLYHQLDKVNIQDIKLISLAQLDTKGVLYVDLDGDSPYYIISSLN